MIVSFIKLQLLLVLLSIINIASSAASPNMDSIEDAIRLATMSRKQSIDNGNPLIETPISDYYMKLTALNNAINKEWGQSMDEIFSAYLLRLWNNDIEELSEENWREVNHPLVRTEIAGLLGQASRLCLLDTSSLPLREYVHSKLSSENLVVKSRAISALGTVGEKNDVPILAKIALEEEAGWAEKAVQSIFMLPYPESVEKLNELEKLVKRKTLRDYIVKKLPNNQGSIEGFKSISCK